jgi:hypothetical protein
MFTEEYSIRTAEKLRLAALAIWQLKTSEFTYPRVTFRRSPSNN